MKTDRRSFLKSAGLLTAAAAVLNPATLFAQAEKVRQIGLDLPIVSDLAHQLNQNGFNLDVDVFDVEKLGDEICQSLSKI